MSIALVVTGGYGNVGITSTPSTITLWGYSIAVAVFGTPRGIVSIVNSLSGDTSISPSLSGNVEIE